MNSYSTACRIIGTNSAHVRNKQCACRVHGLAALVSAVSEKARDTSHFSTSRKRPTWAIFSTQSIMALAAPLLASLWCRRSGTTSSTPRSHYPNLSTVGKRNVIPYLRMVPEGLHHAIIGKRSNVESAQGNPQQATKECERTMSPNSLFMTVYPTHVHFINGF